MSNVQIFKAETMQAALDLVRENLGSDSVILHTRQLSRKHWLPWKKPIVEVEITASKEMQPQSQIRSKKKLTHAYKDHDQLNKKNGQAAGNNRKQKRSSEQTIQKESVASRLTSGNQNYDELDSVSISPQLKKMVSSLSTAPAPIPQAPSVSKTEKRPQRRVNQNQSAPPKRAVTQRSNRSSAERNRTQTGKRATQTRPKNRASEITAPQISTQTQIPGFDLGSMNEFASKLEAIEKMIQHIGRNQQAAPVSSEVPNEVFQIYSELIDSGVDHETARAFVIHLKEQATAEQLEDYQEAKKLLTSLVESTIKVSGPIETHSGKRKIVALVGATGVGKTTTLAKLAGNFRLRSKIKVGLVTVDTYRVAAVDQLRTYAEIIDLPMKVVKSPSEMRQAIDDFTGLDLILIDTAGRSPRDELQIQELKSILAEARVDEVHLVMSMTSSIQTLKATIQKFAPANPTSLIMTKLDEAGGMGPLLSLMHQVSLPISYLTMGQDVPDDIEPGQPARIARLITRKEDLFPAY